jgi:hypothetical protein
MGIWGALLWCAVEHDLVAISEAQDVRSGLCGMQWLLGANAPNLKRGYGARGSLLRVVATDTKRGGSSREFPFRKGEEEGGGGGGRGGVVRAILCLPRQISEKEESRQSVPRLSRTGEICPATRGADLWFPQGPKRSGTSVGVLRGRIVFWLVHTTRSWSLGSMLLNDCDYANDVKSRFLTEMGGCCAKIFYGMARLEGQREEAAEARDKVRITIMIVQHTLVDSRPQVQHIG